MDTERKAEQPEWVDRFLAALRAGKPAAEASRMVGIDSSAPYHRRRRDPAFRAAWHAARPIAPPRAGRELPTRPYGSVKIDRFLTELAETSNVSAAAEAAQVSASKVYKLRRTDPDFARRWYAALAEGYDNLEMELLGRLRSGDESARDKARFDTAAALRCLAAHRESVAREKGRRTLAEEATTIASINAKIDSLRLAGEAGRKAIAEARRDKAGRQAKGAAEPARDADPAGQDDAA